MKFLVIGLGNLGRAIAENLTRIGDEVIGVDLNLHKVEAVKQTISGSVSLDTTDRDALNTLPLSEMDAIFRNRIMRQPMPPRVYWATCSSAGIR